VKENVAIKHPFASSYDTGPGSLLRAFLVVPEILPED
jgi:hypothetical protein